MTKARLEAFSDGVIAIIITIMVLELPKPGGADGRALLGIVPSLLTYLLSFAYVGIYWNNHHHMLHTCSHVTGPVLWANLHLLFWLSLFPYATEFMESSHFAPVPTAAYGGVALLSGLAWLILQTTLIAAHGGATSRLARAVGRDVKGKLSAVLYVAAVGLAFVQPWVSVAIYAATAIMWLVPDPRFERVVNE